MKRRLNRFIPVAIVAAVTVAGLMILNASAERVRSCGNDVSFCFQPLVNQPLDSLRKVEVPDIAVPAWLNDGGEQ